MADLLAKISALTIKMSTAPQTQSAERVVRASSKVTPHHNESDQSDTSVAREHVWFSQNIARTLTNEQYWTHVKNDVLPRSQPFFWEVYKVPRLQIKWARGIRSAAPATRNHHHVQNDDSFTKRDFQILSTLSKRRPSSSSTTPATKHDLHVQKVPQLPRGWKSVRCHAPVPQNDVLDCNMSRKCSSKNEHGALVKRDLQKRSLRDIRFVRACAFEMHMDISQGNFAAVKAKTAHTYETTSNEHWTKPIINYL